MTGTRGIRRTANWTDNPPEADCDGLGSRVCTVDSTGFAYYDWDGINVLQHKDGGGTVTERQVHGHAAIFGVGDIAHMDKSGTTYVPVSDQVGTVWNLLDSSAAKANSYAYDAFGVARSASEAVSDPCRFGTKYLDPDTDLYCFIARQYIATLGRFAGRDPIGQSTGLDPASSNTLNIYIIRERQSLCVSRPAWAHLLGNGL